MNNAEFEARFKEMMNNKDFADKIASAKDDEELAAIFTAEGMPLTAGEAAQFVSAAVASGESGQLSEDALESVSGGLLGVTIFTACVSLAAGAAAINGLITYGAKQLKKK